MSANVFEQYQKYYESLITRHKSKCHLENQNQNLEAKQTQPQDQQAQLNPQQMPQGMSQNSAVPPPHQQQAQQPIQYMMPMYLQQQSNWPQSDLNMYSRSPQAQQYNLAAMQMQYNPHKLLCQQPQLYYGPDGSGYYFCNDINYGPLQQQLQQPQSQAQLAMQPIYTHYPESYNYSQFGAQFPTVPANPNECVHPVQAQQMTQLPVQPNLKPDEHTEAAGALSPQSKALDQTPKKPVFCYPYSVHGFQGGFPCSPCSSCTKKPQPNSAKAATSSDTATRPAPQPCEGNKDCKSSWASNGTPAAASDEPVSSKADKDGDRLPLGVDEPFVVGPTTYQYFYG